MATIYVDSNSNYFQPGDANGQNPAMTDCETTAPGSGHGTVQILTSSIPLPGWQIAPNLTDLGGGIWVNGLLVDPPVVSQ